ncbi:MAG TPA: response regulator [Ktedonobacteraceae bacterium]|nr:response regulator [Ktedonobacteraceae bacterium]
MDKKKILIVDDDPAILDFLTLFLEDVGYEVATASNGNVIRDFPNGMPDLLLLDLWLSGWSGRDICISLKSQEATRHLPIILISANNETEKIAHEAGADDFLAKPFNLDEVQEKIENFL